MVNGAIRHINVQHLLEAHRLSAELQVGGVVIPRRPMLILHRVGRVAPEFYQVGLSHHSQRY